MFKLRQYVRSTFCRKCFGCCRFKEKQSIWIPHILEEEKERLRIEEIDLRLKGNQFICSFLNLKNNLCKIYRTRPFECMLYPFLIQYKNDKIFLAVHLNCPFVKERMSEDDFKDYFSYLKKFFKDAEVLEIIIKNKNIFPIYPAQEIEELAILGC